MATVGMVSLGCPKNQMDAELMLARLEHAGYTLVADAALADVVIINTCGFIEDAKQEAIDQILEFAKLKEEGQIKRLVVTGCLAQRYQQELADELPECDGVIGLGGNGDIADVVAKVLEGESVASFPSRECWSLDGDRVLTTPSFFAYLRIGDGCNNCCTYCAIPGIRGPLRSRQMDNLVEEARTLAAAGVKELVLVAQDVTLYGQDIDGQLHLPRLLDRLCEIEGIEWIRLLYCYPEHITDELLATMARQKKVVKYIDMPIQHVSGDVLAAMNRPGDAASLRALIARMRQIMPDIVIRTTVMTGFPGETEEQFEELCEFVKEVGFERLGCFAFSPEEGTVAATLPNQIDKEEKERRRDIVMEEQALVADRFNQSQVGKTLDVLVESFDRYAECWFGRSAADAPDIDGKVFFTAPGGAVAPGQMVKVLITDTMDWDIMGEYVP